MSDKDRPYNKRQSNGLKPPMPPSFTEPPSAAPPPPPSSSSKSAKVGNGIATKQDGAKPHQGFHYRISLSRPDGKEFEPRELGSRNRDPVATGDTLIITTASDRPCWIYVVETMTEKRRGPSTHLVRAVTETTGEPAILQYQVYNTFNKLRILFSEDKIDGITEGTTATSDAKHEQTSGNWLLNLDRFNPAAPIGGRGYGTPPQPEDMPLERPFHFSPSPSGQHDLQTKSMLRSLPTGYFLALDPVDANSSAFDIQQSAFHSRLRRRLKMAEWLLIGSKMFNGKGSESIKEQEARIEGLARTLRELDDASNIDAEGPRRREMAQVINRSEASDQ